MTTKNKIMNAVAAIALLVVGCCFLGFAANEPVVKPVAAAVVETIEVPEIAIVIEAPVTAVKKAPVAVKTAKKVVKGLNDVPNLSDRRMAWSGAKRTTLGQTAFDVAVDAGGNATAVVR